jgi:YidC/Oxa1 family membrane protein insertase
MEMDKKTIIAVVLSFAIWMTWEQFYLKPIRHQAEVESQRYQEAIAKRAKETKDAQAATAAQAQLGAAPEAAAKGKKDKAGANGSMAPEASQLKELRLENDSSAVTVSNGPWAVGNWQLKSFSRTLEKLDEKITLEEATGFGTQLHIRFSDAALNQAASQNWASIEKENERRAVARLSSPDVEGSRALTLNDDGYGGLLEYSFKFKKEPPKFVFVDVLGSTKRANDREGSIFGQAPDKVHVTYRDLTGRHSQMGASLSENIEAMSSVKWLGLDTRYFVMALVPTGESAGEAGVQVVKELEGTPSVRGSLAFPTQGKRDFSFSTKVYFGPKHMESLTKVDPLLSDAIDFGWTSAIAIPLLQGLKWLYSYLKNYGLAIIALTFLIKMALFPLMYKSMTSMAKMSKLQPQLNALREKYKDDKEKLNVEMMSFMKANGYNPVGGCLPILFQMPIFFALYRVLFNSMELYQAPFYGWIHDLSSPDPFFVTPVLLMGLMFLQQRLSPTTAMDPAQQKMLQIMPVMFGAFMLMLPSGLTIYMVVNSVVSIAQQYFLNRKLGIKRNPPATTATA